MYIRADSLCIWHSLCVASPKGYFPWTPSAPNFYSWTFFIFSVHVRVLSKSIFDSTFINIYGLWSPFCDWGRSHCIYQVIINIICSSTWTWNFTEKAKPCMIWGLCLQEATKSANMQFLFIFLINDEKKKNKHLWKVFLTTERHNKEMTQN